MINQAMAAKIITANGDVLNLTPEEEEVAVAAVKLRRLHIFMEKRKASERSYNL
jgi:hypothetical protein